MNDTEPECDMYWLGDDGKLYFCCLNKGHSEECESVEGMSYSQTVEMIL